MADLLSVLYCGTLNISPDSMDSNNRDRFILSKGHGCAALYAVLGERGFFPVSLLDSFYQNGSKLLGHATCGVPGVEFSTGALGHGLSVACGMALAGKRGSNAYRVFSLLSDGECEEGSTWEAVLFASHHQLDNLTVIIDYNKMQAMGKVLEILNLEPFAPKWSAFGWGVHEIDGHDLAAIHEALTRLPIEHGKPSCVIAHTIKGKGISFMEDSLLWHYRSPNSQELGLALSELEE
jgi:transketolase